jgi:hypothetical protein
MDAKTEMQAFERTQPVLPMIDGGAVDRPARAAHLGLRLPRHHLTVRGPGCGGPQSDRPLLLLAPRRGVCKGRSHMYRLGSPIVYQSGEPWVLRAA